MRPTQLKKISYQISFEYKRNKKFSVRHQKFDLAASEGLKILNKMKQVLVIFLALFVCNSSAQFWRACHLPKPVPTS